MPQKGGCFPRKFSLYTSMENFRPLSSDLGDLRELAEALGGVLQVLELTQLVPPTGKTRALLMSNQKMLYALITLCIMMTDLSERVDVTIPSACSCRPRCEQGSSSGHANQVHPVKCHVLEVNPFHLVFETGFEIIL